MHEQARRGDRRLVVQTSHLIKRFELGNYVRRESDGVDGRYTNAILNEAGLWLLVSSSPAHVAKVRELVIDALTQEELRQLGRASESIQQAIATGSESPAG